MKGLSDELHASFPGHPKELEQISQTNGSKQERVSKKCSSVSARLIFGLWSAKNTLFTDIVAAGTDGKLHFERSPLPTGNGRSPHLSLCWTVNSLSSGCVTNLATAMLLSPPATSGTECKRNPPNVLHGTTFASKVLQKHPSNFITFSV